MSRPDLSAPVLVTGGGGFAGSYIVRALRDRGYEVVVLDVADPRPESLAVIADDRVEFIRARTDEGSVASDIVGRLAPGAIVHAGWNLDLDATDTDPLVTLADVHSSLNLLDAARRHGVRRFIFFSSIGVIPRVTYEPLDGNHPVLLAREGPEWAYSAAKLTVEAYCFTYQRSFGLDFRTIRASAMYGFGMSRFAPNYMKQIVEPAVRGEAVRLATGGPVPRDYVHILDVAALVVAALEGPDDADRIFYGATGEPLRTGADVAAVVRELLPGAVIEIGDGVTEEDRRELVCRGRISMENARTQLGFSPRYAELRDGVGEYIERYRTFLERSVGDPAAAAP
jgi:nucleoside-diphosphate-sugar epimerase